MQGRIEVAGPLDLELSARLLCAPPRAGRGWHATGDYWHGHEYRRLVWWTGQPALLRLFNRGSIERPDLGWRLEEPRRGHGQNGHPLPSVEARPQATNGSDQAKSGEPRVSGGAGDRAAIAHRVRHLISADTDLAACYASFRPDPVLGPLSERFRGLRILRFPSLYECLVATILEQQLNFWFAAQVKRQLFTAFGPELVFEGRHYIGVPAPARLAELTPEALRPLQISAPKARALAAVAAAARDGALDPPLVPDAHDAEAVAEHLMRLRGVGRWSATYARLRGLGHTDALPSDDVGLLRSVTHLYGARSPVTPQGLQRRWKKLAPWRGYATYYVWLTQWLGE